MALEVEIDRDACMGSGNCVYEAAGVFDLDDDGISTVVDSTAAPEEQIIAAARKCPTKAISVRRDGVAVPLN
jgi:ferredoxin